MNETPSYYNKNGLSPVEAMNNGLISNEEYVGFLKGNILKYIVRCEYKEDTVSDLKKAQHYLSLLITYYMDLVMCDDRG